MELLIVDDFSREDGRSSLGTEWRFFTDRVMGGVSRGSAARDSIGDTRRLRLRGEVSLENDGGFIQAALSLDPGGGSFDASGDRGIRIAVTGGGGAYFLHLRTEDTVLPWQYYQAPFVATGEWREVDLPFSAFRGQNLRPALDPKRLRRVALVAAKLAGLAEVSLTRIAFYR